MPLFQKHNILQICTLTFGKVNQDRNLILAYWYKHLLQSQSMKMDFLCCHFQKIKLYRSDPGKRS